MLVRPGFEPVTSRSADRRSPNWANQGQQLSCAIGTRRSRAQDKWGISLLPLLRTSVFIYAHFNCVTSRWGEVAIFFARYPRFMKVLHRDHLTEISTVKTWFNVKCSKRNQASLQNTLLCPVHYHSFKKLKKNVTEKKTTENTAAHNWFYTDEHQGGAGQSIRPRFDPS